MTCLCREFGISRKTGYKILEHYKQCGVERSSDRGSAAFRYANQLTEQVEATIAHAVKVPACSCIHAVLDRHGLVSCPPRLRTRAQARACWKA